MSDRVYGRIRFPAAALGDVEVVELVEQYAGQVDWDEEGIAAFAAEDAEDGEFPALEDLLVAKGIPFDRYASSTGHLDARERHFRPAGQGQPVLDVTYITTREVPGPLVSVAQVLHRLAEDGPQGLERWLRTCFPPVPPLRACLRGEG